MPSSPIRQIADSASLAEAWRDLDSRATPASRNTIGNDGLSINDIKADVKGNLVRIARDLRAGKYAFQSLRPYLIPKPNGKERLICVPTVQDRIVQRALLNYLQGLYGHRLDNGISYGFIKGKTVPDAAREACRLRAKHPWLFKTDITSFFDRVDRDLMKAALRRLVRQRSLHPILESVVDCEIFTHSNSKNRRIHQLGIHGGKGIRQGMPLSPFLSNVLLLGFDKWIESKGIPAIRYADDLVFFADSKNDCQNLALACASELKRLQLDIPDIKNNSKSVIYEPTAHGEFLGLGLCQSGAGYDLRLLPKQLEKVLNSMRHFSSVKELVSRKIRFATLGQRLEAKRNGYLAAYELCSNFAELKNRLNEVIDRALRDLYSRDLGIDIGKLSPEARAFLHLA